VSFTETTLTKGQHITGSARERLAADLKKRYEKRASIRQLAEDLGRSYGFVHRLLVEAGTTFRGHDGNPSTNDTRRSSARAAGSGARASRQNAELR
jgi:hypothetical protein